MIPLKALSYSGKPISGSSTAMLFIMKANLFSDILNCADGMDALYEKDVEEIMKDIKISIDDDCDFIVKGTKFKVVSSYDLAYNVAKDVVALVVEKGNLELVNNIYQFKKGIGKLVLTNMILHFTLNSKR